jgi:predicted small secreted protein
MANEIVSYVILSMLIITGCNTMTELSLRRWV